MDNPKHYQGVRQLLVLTSFILVISFSCTQKTWQIINNPTITTANMECGEQEVILYTNTGNKTEYLIFKFDNRCEFTAYTYALGSDSIMKANSQFQIPGFSTRQASYVLAPGESFEATCTLVSSVNGRGCVVTHWVRARK